MKYWMMVLLMMQACSLPAAESCGVFGIEGHISDDGALIQDRHPIAILDQVRRYGGYEQAAKGLEANRSWIVGDTHFSAAVREAVDRDMRANIAAIRCWETECRRNPQGVGCSH
ncbi:hypothetical protein ACYJW8_04450 [Frateuria aurantia]